MKAYPRQDKITTELEKMNAKEKAEELDNM